MLSNRMGVALCALCAVAWAGLYGGVRWGSDTDRRGANGCPLDATKIETAWVIAVDATDRIAAPQLARIAPQIEAEIAAAKRNDYIAIHIIDGDPESVSRPFVPLHGSAYARCKTVDQDPDHINGAVATAAEVRRRYEREMIAPLAPVMSAIGALPEAKRSPLIASWESLLWAGAWGGAKDRRLVMISDMLEVSPQLNQPKNGVGNFCDVVLSQQGDRLKSQGFAGLKVTLLYQKNREFLVRQGTPHTSYWKNLTYALGGAEFRLGNTLLKNDTPHCAPQAAVHILNQAPAAPKLARTQP